MRKKRLENQRRSVTNQKNTRQNNENSLADRAAEQTTSDGNDVDELLHTENDSSMEPEISCSIDNDSAMGNNTDENDQFQQALQQIEMLSSKISEKEQRCKELECVVAEEDEQLLKALQLIEELTSKVAEKEERCKELESAVVLLNARGKELESIVTAFNAREKEVDSFMTAVNTRAKELESIVTGCEVKKAELEQNIDKLCKKNTDLEEINAKLKEKVSFFEAQSFDGKKDMEEKIAALKSKCLSMESLKENEKFINFYTGLPDYDTLKAVLDLACKSLQSTVPHGLRKLTNDDEFLLTIVKLRLNLRNADLAFRFGIAESTVSNIIHKWLNILYVSLNFLIRWPTREEIRATLPECFRPKFKDAVVIIDCTEVFIERATNLLARSQTWSNYKSHNTTKVLIGITPQGTVSFVSKAWGGRVSD